MRTPQAYRGGEMVLVLDCSNLESSVRFWTEVLGYEATGPVSGPPAAQYRSLYPPGGTGIELLLQSVPDVKLQKNRLHLDLRTGDLEAEVRRVAALGARMLTHQPVVEEGWRWHVLADPDGNEFCVLQPPDGPDGQDGPDAAERAAGAGGLAGPAGPHSGPSRDGTA